MIFLLWLSFPLSFIVYTTWVTRYCSSRVRSGRCWPFWINSNIWTVLESSTHNECVYEEISSKFTAKIITRKNNQILCGSSPGLVLCGVFCVANKWKDVRNERSLIANERSKWCCCKCAKVKGLKR